MSTIAPILALLIGYLVGSFPTGYLAGRVFAGVDVRQVGSGRTGGTNVLRSAGRTAALVTIFGDTIKGIICVLLVKYFLPDDFLAHALAAVGIVLGHNYSVFLKFKGGAGTMTGAGSLLALHPLTLVFTAILPVLFAYLTRMSSIGSLLFTSIGLLISVLLYSVNSIPPAYLIYTAFFCAISWYAHRPNIQRLMAGNERRIGEKA